MENRTALGSAAFWNMMQAVWGVLGTSYLIALLLAVTSPKAERRGGFGLRRARIAET